MANVVSVVFILVLILLKEEPRLVGRNVLSFLSSIFPRLIQSVKFRLKCHSTDVHISKRGFAAIFCL